MSICCTITVAPGLYGPAATALHAAFGAAGWQGGSAGSWKVTLPASPTAVDAPAIQLGGMLQSLVASCPEQGVEVDCVVTCRYGEEEIFTDRLHLRAAPEGGAGFVPEATGPPFFSDLMRLRDKILATIQRVHRGS